MPDDPVLVLRIGQQMVDIVDTHDGLMESVYWSDRDKCWLPDGEIGISKPLAEGLNRLGYRPEATPTPGQQGARV